MVERVVINETLAVFVQTGKDPQVWIDRTGGGLVVVRANEIKAVIEALCASAGLLAVAEAQRARSSRAVIEARRLRRRRVAGGLHGEVLE